MALPAPIGDWNDEQKALRKGLQKYYEALNAGVLEDDAAERFNRDKWQLIRESGVIRIPFAEQWGGLGHDALTLVYVLEELGYGCRDAGLLFALATQVVSAAIPLQKFGSEELKERYLARLIDGEIISAHAISEPSAGSDAMAMSTTATPDGDGYLLNGGKTFITNGPIADVITVYAKLETGDGASGITAFLVPTDTPGFHVGPPIAKLGLNTCPFCELEFTDCRVPASNIVGKPGAGFFILEHVMNWEILCIFIMMAGEMQERMERCIAHVKKRTAFGVPIASNQYVAGKIVDQKIGIETVAQTPLRHRSAVRQGTQRHHRDLDGEAGHERGQSGLRAVRRATVRRPRLHARVRHGEGAARRGRRPDLLGHERDAARAYRFDARPVGWGRDMGLMTGTGPLSRTPAGVFNFDPPAGGSVYLEPTAKRIRVMVDDVTIADSVRASIMSETNLQPVYYFPPDDVRADVLVPSERRTHCARKGDARYYSIELGDRLIENAAWTYPEPIAGSPGSAA